MATIRTNISLLARWRPYRLPLPSAVFNSTERFGVVHELAVLFCASRRFEHEDDDEHEDETLVAASPRCASVVNPSLRHLLRSSLRALKTDAGSVGLPETPIASRLPDAPSFYDSKDL